MANPLSAAAAAALFALAIPNAAFAEDEVKKEEDSTEAPRSSSALRQRGALLDASPQNQKPQISGWLFVPWYYGIGVGFGARFAYPIMPDGFIPSLNDSFELEGGADIWYGSYFGFGYSYIGLAAPIVEARWTFHITDKFAAYGKLGLGWSFAFVNGPYSSGLWGGGFYWNAGPGILYKFGDTMYLRAEVASQGLRVGFGLDI